MPNMEIYTNLDITINRENTIEKLIIVFFVLIFTVLNF